MVMFIKFFRDISKRDVVSAGGKGASLGEMTKAGIPVPPGFVVLAQAFDHFLEETDLGSAIESILHKVDHRDVNSVEVASEKIRAHIARERMPGDIKKQIESSYKKLTHGKKILVAVRSSATAEDSKTASWAGELETYLNVGPKTLISDIVKCWASLFTPRAIFYRFEKKFHKKAVSVAVVVQEMVQSEVSGICFTVHPVTKDYDQMIIEAGFGLGEAIVSGQITPDTYVIHKKKLTLLEVNVSEQSLAIVRGAKGTVHKKLNTKVGSKQKLNGKQIMELANLCLKIESHYRHPQDIEWTFSRKKFYITQSRPITTL